MLFQSVWKISLLCSQGRLPGGEMPELLLEEWEGVNEERDGEGQSGPRVSMSEGRGLWSHGTPPAVWFFRHTRCRWREISGWVGLFCIFPVSAQRLIFLRWVFQTRPEWFLRPNSKSDHVVTWFQSPLVTFPSEVTGNLAPPWPSSSNTILPVGSTSFFSFFLRQRRPP